MEERKALRVDGGFVMLVRSYGTDDDALNIGPKRGRNKTSRQQSTKDSGERGASGRVIEIQMENELESYELTTRMASSLAQCRMYSRASSFMDSLLMPVA